MALASLAAIKARILTVPRDTLITYLEAISVTGTITIGGDGTVTVNGNALTGAQYQQLAGMIL
jgi:hypothetical protein